MLIHSTGVQPPLALHYGMFVTAAYDVYSKFPTKLNPSQSDYPSFPSGYKLIKNIQMSDFFRKTTTPKYYGFMAQEIANPSAYVTAFRGTETLEEWWDDFHWGLVPFPYLPNAGNVASGFLKIYSTMTFTSPNSKSTTKGITKLPGGVNLSAPNATMVAVGHSLGAALITLYGLNLVAKGTNPVVYTFASPRVGDTAFANAYDANVATNYRIVNWPDLVPRFPKDIYDNYQHVKGKYEVDSLDHPLTVKPTFECFHSLLTYIFLVGAPSSTLGACKV